MTAQVTCECIPEQRGLSSHLGGGRLQYCVPENKYFEEWKNEELTQLTLSIARLWHKFQTWSIINTRQKDVCERDGEKLPSSLVVSNETQATFPIQAGT